jgi:hypothetical protein
MTKPISPVLTDNLIRSARALAEANGSSMRTVSRQIHGDPPFFDNLIAGTCSVTLRKYDECMAKFDDKWPENVVRPVLNNPHHGKPKGPAHGKKSHDQKDRRTQGGGEEGQHEAKAQE